MDAKNTNIFARRAMGFFMTQRKRTDANAFEHDLQEGAFKIAADSLRESKIRGATIHDNFGGIYAIAEKVEKFVEEFSDAKGQKTDWETAGSALSQAQAVVQACIGQQAYLADKRKEISESKDSKSSNDKAEKTEKAEKRD